MRKGRDLENCLRQKKIPVGKKNRDNTYFHFTHDDVSDLYMKQFVTFSDTGRGYRLLVFYKRNIYTSRR